MNELQFCYWLKGLFELSDVKSLDETQTQIIREHLDLVFNKVTPTPGYIFSSQPQLQPSLDLTKVCSWHDNTLTAASC